MAAKFLLGCVRGFVLAMLCSQVAKVAWSAPAVQRRAPPETATGESQPSRLMDIKCDLCKFLAGEVLAVIKESNNTDKLVEHVLESICSKVFAGQLLAECEHFVEEYADEFLQLLLQELDSSVVCAQLHVCPNATSLGISPRNERGFRRPRLPSVVL